ncbi:MAG: preprotein translocase subunit SecY [Pyrodictiaceae archaeon]
MGVLEAIAALSRYIPSVEKPARRPSLPARLAWTAIILVLYYIMSEVPLYGVMLKGVQSPTLTSILLGMNTGTLMTLGIGPIVTAGIVLQVLVGGGFLDLDLSKPRDRRLFMDAQRTLTLLFALLEASAYSVGCAFWMPAMGVPGTCPAGVGPRILVVVQLLIATLIIMWFDEMSQKGWGIGSALSLIIVASVMKGMAWQLAGLTPIPTREGGVQYYGWLTHVIMTGDPAILRYSYPDLVGLITTVVTIVVLIYLQLMRVYIPVTSPRYGGVKSRIPLNFIYVTNIPILFVGITAADLRILANMLASFVGANHPVTKATAAIAYYANPPHGLLQALSDPVHLLIFSVIWLALSLVFGFIWVEVAGLNPQKQAENILKSGLEVPGLRRNPRILESLLARYIYPLTIISSLIVGAIAVIASIFGAYGTGSGLILLVGILYSFYTQLSYERTLEMYPMLRRIIEGA